MVRLRKSHTKLKIALCSVCGFFVAIGGVLGIWVLSSALQGEKEVVRPEDTVSVRKELPSGGTYSELKSDGLDTLGYLAYVLDRQEFYHSESSTSSVAMIATQTTQSFKDYKDGIMLSSDFTYGFVSAGTQSCFVPDGNENGEGAGVYMRTSNGSVNSSSTGTNTNWNDDVRYYPEEEYLYTYGQYSTEMTVYILNDETVTSWDEVRDNGDGTYSQKFYLDAEKAAYYYQYAMKTRGGLDTLPIFKSVTLDITFDDSYHVLEIDAVEDTNITYIFSMDSTSTTTTTYSYDEVSFDQPHRDLYDTYYKDYVGKLQSGDNEEEQIDVISLLAGAFANVLNGQGQQFDATLTLGNTPYYGRVYLNVDMGGISSGDILGAIEARIQLSADRSFDSQDLYIELSDGKVSGYYSTGFALTADINSFGDIIDKFETWISTLDFGSSSDGGTDGEGEGEDQPDEGEGDSSSSLNDILEQLLGGLVLEESEGGVSVSLDISDLLGIGLSAKLDFTASEGADGTTEYSFVSADIGGITYGGENIALSLGLAPSAAENISHDESETPFNVNEAADSLYQLLSSQTLKLRLSLEGAELADFASAIGIADPGDSLDNLKLEVEGGVALDGLTVNAAVCLIDTSAEKTLLDADVYYIYNGSSGAYGTAYLAITNLLGVECDAKVYCDIADLADTITKLVASFSGEGDEGSEVGGAAALAEDGSDLVSVINGVLSLDFGSVIKELTANNTVIGATVNADEILALLGIDVTLGDITLEYSLGDFDAEDYNTEGGWLHGSVPSLGAEVYVYGSTLAIDEINFEEYLDLDVLLGSVIGVLSSETVTVDLTVTGGAVADILAGAGLADLGASLDGLTLNVSGGVSISSLPSALAARANVNLTNGDLPYVVADVFYAYEEGGMGTAYITITNLLGADLSASPVKVKCDISDAVTAIEQLIGAVEEVLLLTEESQPEGEGNDIASIISGVLAIDFGSIIKELTINADVLSTTIDADNLIAMFSDVSLGLGEVTLEYNTEGTLTGSALNGEVALEVSGSDSTLTAPDDSEFLDINEVLNTVKDILENKLVALSLDLDETGLANLLKGVGAEDYVSLAKGLGLTVDGTLDIEQLAAIVNINLTRNEDTLLAGQIYYDYDEASDGETSYGTAQLYITNILGATCDIKVKCDIAELAESIQQIIAMFSAPDPNEPAPTSDPEADNTVVGIISEMLELDFPAIIEKLTANASGFETEIDVDALLGELEVTGISLGKVTLKYDTETEKLTGSALSGLTLEAYKGTQEVKPIDGEFLDLNEVLNTVTDILTNKLVALSLNLDEAGLANLLKGVGAEDYVSLAEGLGLTVGGTLDIEQLAALVSINLTRNDSTILAGQIYYDYNDAPDGETSYGTAQLYITNVLGAECDIKVKCDIAELAESIQQIIAMFSAPDPNEPAPTSAPEADNTVAAIVSQILELDFPAIIEKLTANASGFETEIDVDALLGELEVTGISLGTVTLKYDTETEKLTGSALGGLTLEAYKGTQEVKPIDGEFLDLNDVLNTVKDILENKLVALSLTLDETGLETLLKGVGAEDYVSLAKGLGLTVDGTLDIEQLAALVNITLTRGDSSILAGQIYYDYDEAPDGETSYGTAQLYITNILGATCDIKVKCDIAGLAESIQQIIAMFSAPDPNEPAPTSAPEADNTVVGIISEILELDFPAIIEKLTANASGFETEIDVDALLGELEVTGITLGTVTLKYDTATKKLTGSALGGLTLEAYKGTQEVKPIDGEFLDINEVIEIALAVSEQVQAIINEEQIHFDIDAGATIDGVAVGIEGSAAVDWVGGTLNKLAVTATLSLQNSGEANRSATAFTFLYNNGAADSDPYIRIGIGEEVLNITKGDIATVSAQIEELKVQIQKLIDAINGGSAQSDGETAQIVAEIARLSGISAITVDGGDGGIKEPDAVIIINALLDALLGANENGENVLADIFGAIMSGTSVSADDLSLAVKMLFENIGASLSIGLDNGGRLSLGGTVTSGGAEVADLHISAKSGLGGVFEKIDGSLDELNQNSSSEEVAFVKIVYDYLFKAIGNVNIGDYLGSDAYKVSFRLGGDGSKIPELAGVQVTADLYFAGNYQGGNLIRADISNLTVDGFNLSADVVYLNNTLYIDLENIDGTALSGLKVQVQADDIYKAVENIIALIKNDKVINFFGSVAGSFRTSGGEGQEAAGAAVTLSEEQEKTFTDILVALLSLDYSEVVKISSADGATTITADIDAVLKAVGVDVSVGSAQIVAEKDRLTVGLSHENSNYNWIQLVAERSESLNFDTSSLTVYIDIGFVADIVDDAGKFITSNAPADGEISTLFTLNGGTISADVDISDIDFSSALGDEWWSGIVGAVLKGLDIDPITISNIDLVIGLDSAGELYFSLEGDLSAVSVTALGFIPIEFVVANSIGITYSDGLITLKKDSGGSPIYWVMTPEYFIDNLFAEQSDENGTDSPIRWLLGTGSSIWNLIASNLGGLIDIDSGITSPDEITLYPVSNGGRDGGNEEATALSQFLAGYAIKLGEENAYTYGGYSAALERLGLKDSNNYYAFALNASGLTGGMLDALDVALLRDETYGFGGLKAYASVMSGAVVVNFNIGYSGYKAPTDSSVPANYYENAVGSLSDAARQEFDNALTLNNDVTANINGIDTVYAYDVFGGVKIEGGVLGTVNTQREYVDELLTVTVYESVEDMEAGVNAATYKVRYGSVINLHDDWNIMSDDSGNVYVYVAADDTSGTYPETYTVENDTVFYKTTVSGEEWTTAKVTINGQTFVVKHGTSLNDIVANKFGGYGVVGGWKQVMSDGARQDYTATAVTEDVELEAQFARLSVTAENGVVYTLGGGTQGEGVNTVYDHYEVTGYTQAISAYYEENTTLVLENEVDGVPVTAIAANALQYRGNGQGLQNVVVPENITTIGGRAFLDNYGIKSVVFLADTITLNNNDAENSGTKGYPFYGCSISSEEADKAITYLNVYYKNITNSGEDWMLFRDSDGTYYINTKGGRIWSNGSWAWVTYNVIVDEGASGLLSMSAEDYLAGLPESGKVITTFDFVDAQSVVEQIMYTIDSYTYEQFGYIGSCEVTASSGITLTGAITVEISITATGEEWYPVQVINNKIEGNFGGNYSFNAGEYKILPGVYGDDGVLLNFVKLGSEVTLTATAYEGYEFNEFQTEIEGTIVENKFTFTADTQNAISIFWTEKEIVGVTVYSELPFIFNSVTGEQKVFSGRADNTYTIENADIGLETSILGAVKAYENEGWYFLGWATGIVGNDGTISNLEFKSAVIDESVYGNDGISYIAVWGYSSCSITENTCNNGNQLAAAVKTDTNAEGDFYRWYDGNYYNNEGVQTDVLTGTTLYYARWQFTLSFSFTGSQTNRIHSDRINDLYTKDFGRNKTTLTVTELGFDIYEGSYIVRTFAESVVNGKTLTKMTVKAYYSEASYMAGESEYYWDTIYMYKETWNWGGIGYVDGDARALTPDMSAGWISMGSNNKDAYIASVTGNTDITCEF